MAEHGAKHEAGEDRADQRLRAVRRMFRSPSAWVGAAIVMLLVLAAVAADGVTSFNPEALVADPFEPPSAAHWLGTDSVGRDLFSRLIYGARLSLAAGAVSVLVAMVIGTAAGAVAGFVGGWLDTLVMRAIDVILAFPSILVALLVVAALSPGWVPVMLAVGLINVPIFCRQVRATVLTVRHLDYVTAARAAGASPAYLLLRVVLPALVSPLAVLATLGLGTAILEVAGLSFLGIAGESTTPEWGNMLTTVKDNLSKLHWGALGPGVAIALAVIGFNLLGDGLRDALDPRLDRRSS
ncbi:MAG: ABC transporter permease [Pirellulales bacterium]|nr:ABC transporter permease [Pirellulales bacterium]